MSRGAPDLERLSPQSTPTARLAPVHFAEMAATIVFSLGVAVFPYVSLSTLLGAGLSFALLSSASIVFYWVGRFLFDARAVLGPVRSPSPILMLVTALFSLLVFSLPFAVTASTLGVLRALQHEWRERNEGVDVQAWPLQSLIDPQVPSLVISIFFSAVSFAISAGVGAKGSDLATTPGMTLQTLFGLPICLCISAFYLLAGGWHVRTQWHLLPAIYGRFAQVRGPASRT